MTTSLAGPSVQSPPRRRWRRCGCGRGRRLGPDGEVARAAAAAPAAPAGPALTTGRPASSTRPIPTSCLTLRAGVQVSPAYLGSDEYEVGPDLAARLDYVRFPGGFEFGSGPHRRLPHRLGPARLGALPRRARFGRARRDRGPRRRRLVVRARPRRRLRAAQLARLHRRALRRHRPQRLGGRGRRRRHRLSDRRPDAHARPAPLVRRPTASRRPTSASPPAESAASDLPEFDASGGLLGAGVELGARYLFNERWGVEGAASWNRLVNDAADSPVTATGSEDQYEVRLGITRSISLDF